MDFQKKGFFCVIEGMDGSGKSTLLASIRKLLEGAPDPNGRYAFLDRLREMSPVFLAEPTRLPTGMELRRRLSSPEPPGTKEWIELFRADRRANLDTFVNPALDRGALVFQDRYYYSTAAYQGAFASREGGGEPGPQSVLELFTSWCPAPDLLVYLMVDLDVAFARMDARGGTQEHFEQRDRWIRIRDAYEQVLPRDTLRIDGTLPSEEAALLVLTTIAGRLPPGKENT